jgi:trigger factor
MAPSDPDTPQHDHPADGAQPVSPPEDSDELSLPEDFAQPQAGETQEPAEQVEVEREIEKELDEEEAKEKLTLEVDVQGRSACERHIVTKISREDVDRVLDKEYSELVTSAQVPGFRPGHAPRKLVEKRFHKEVSERVKGSLLADAIAQLTDEQKLSPISEPVLDLDAVEVPDEGPMTFEFDIEVRPDFDLPQWKGMTIGRPVHEFTDEDIDRELKNLLSRHGRLVPYAGPAESGDYISTNLRFDYQGQVLSSAAEELIRIRPVLSFRDGKIEKFDELMKGVCAGETRSGEAQLSDDAPNQALRGCSVTATFEVLEVKRLELPEITEEFLSALGSFDSEADLRDAIRDNLKRQLVYQQHRRAREQITAALTVAADWELPPELLKRQSQRELQRAVMELRRSGFGDEEIRVYENQLRQNSRQSTARALKEHFILERIAEEEKIEDAPADYDVEVKLIAEQSGETPRRVRARLEKANQMDVLRNQIIERKVIELILEHATFKEVPYEPESLEAEALERSAGGEEAKAEEPEAQP